MSATILDGRKIAKEIEDEVRLGVQQLKVSRDVIPSLAVVLVGEDAASMKYVENKERACRRVGIHSAVYPLPDTASAKEIESLLRRLSVGRRIHGILMQLPLPEALPELLLSRQIQELKDVDCFHPHNIGLLMQGTPRFVPCTPAGVCQLLQRANIVTSGRHVVVVGRSLLVGRPLSVLLSGKDTGNATVTLCHSGTRLLGEHTRQADILIVATGQINTITKGMVKPGAVVIDVGINVLSDRSMRGDVDFDAVAQVAGSITPVPGGVGPLTVAMLLHNTLKAAQILTEQ